MAVARMAATTWSAVQAGWAARSSAADAGGERGSGAGSHGLNVGSVAEIEATEALGGIRRVGRRW